jgi:bacillolysin
VVDPVLSVNNEWQPQFLSITPNPTLDILNVEYKDENTEPVYFQLLNFNGQTLKKEIRNGGAGLVAVRWSLSELPAGIYFVKINQKEKTVTRKIIKQ